MSAIEVASLRKSYGALNAVDSISFSVAKGDVFSLLGPNGAGKTTTIEILEGLRERDGGDVKVLGLDPWKNGYEVHRSIGVIPQGFKFVDYATPREAVKYYAALFGVKADADAILRRVILEDSANVYFSKLSGGQKQKVGLALALVNDPELVFLDEPTTGLDPQARRAVWEVIRNLKSEGRSVLLTTHYLEEAEELSDTVAIMNHGRIITAGTPAEIIARHGSGERIRVRGDQKLADYLRKAIPSVPVDYHADSGEVTISVGRKEDSLFALEAIERSDLPWNDLSIARESLEDVFVKLIGGEGHGQAAVGAKHEVARAATEGA
ncbi:MAG: ABC transporter ATP-binding protein [Nitrososphaerota archaeon]|nr:ABC transporter ATP-binding protein [Nitrososphaerota archaeon]MDG6977920.1 ABC transporter ATP-binding protein [Nitrososphaerota archaeon]MDG7022582.1 ABC transporter ATP-binding protein [Nitrososphaerota archaeon]